MWRAFLLITFFLAKGNANECVPRKFGTDRIVCVCNATYCDGLPEDEPEVPEDGESSYWYVTNKQGLRLRRLQVKFESGQNVPSSHDLILNTTKTYQTVFGFGGAFTDSFGINLKRLSEATQDQLIKTYYDQKAGSRYTIGRIPIAGTDCSTRPYTYDDVEDDTSLQYFKLAPEDFEYKIPYIKKAIKLSPNVKLFSSSWSAPPWMKTNNKINGYGFLKDEYYQLYADYLLKFLQEYKNHDIDIWGITTGNEPFDTYIPDNPLNDMGWTPSTVAKWVAENLGPTLAASNHNETQIMVLDDQRFNLPWYIEEVFKNEEAMKYIAGTAIHWYGDGYAPPDVMDQTHDDFPEKFILMTEACTGFLPTDIPKVDLGSWDRGERYILSIIEDMNHWSIGWVDWNLALDKQGGPNWIKNFIDAPVIVNPERDEFYKQPMFYALKHFSRFVGRGSVRVSITDNIAIKSAAFVTPSKEVVAVLYNGESVPQHVTLRDTKKGTIHLELSPYSMNTLKYKQ